MPDYQSLRKGDYHIMLRETNSKNHNLEKPQICIISQLTLTAGSIAIQI